MSEKSKLEKTIHCNDDTSNSDQFYSETDQLEDGKLLYVNRNEELTIGCSKNQELEYSWNCSN